MDSTNHTSGAMLVPEPGGQEFESGHSQFHDRKAGVLAKSATDTVDLAVAELRPKTSLYHLIKLGRLSVSRAIMNDVDGVRLMQI